MTRMKLTLTTPVAALIKAAHHDYACDEAVDWLCTLPADTTVEQVIRDCPQVSWFDWAAERWLPGKAWATYDAAMAGALITVLRDEVRQ